MKGLLMATAAESTYIAVEEDPLSYKSIFSYESAFTYSRKVSPDEGTESSKEIGKWEAGCRAVILTLVAVILLPFSPIVLWKCVHYMPQWERVAIFRLGRFRGVKGPGYVLLLPVVDKWRKMDLRTKILFLRNIQVVTSDTAIMAFSVEITYRIADSTQNVLRLSEPEKTLESLCRTTIVNKATTLTQVALEKERKAVGNFVREKLNESIRPWGYEVSEVSLPEVVVQKGAVVVEKNPLEPLEMIFKGLVGAGQNSSMPGNPLLQTFTGSLFETMGEKFAEVASESPDSDTPGLVGASRLKSTVESVIGRLKSPPTVDQQGLYCLAPARGPKVHVILADKSWVEEGDFCSLGVQPDVTVEADSEDAIIDVMTKKVSPYEAYFGGTIRVEGNVSKLMGLSDLI